MWVSPLDLIDAIVDGIRRDRLVGELHRMDDRLLQDLGLRRDQLDLLRLPRAPSSPGMLRPAGAPVSRPSLQGCG